MPTSTLGLFSTSLYETLRGALISCSCRRSTFKTISISFIPVDFLLLSWIRVFLNHLEAIISPATKLHDTCLLIKWKILHIHLTGGMIYCRRFPLNIPSVVQSCFCCKGNLKIAISTEIFKIFFWNSYKQELMCKDTYCSAWLRLKLITKVPFNTI